MTSRRLTGIPASPGTGIGRAVIGTPARHGTPPLQPTGFVLVSQQATPDLVAWIVRANGIVTDFGGATSHVASIARELGIPCIVGARQATVLIPPGVLVTVNGDTGEVSWDTKSEQD